MVAAGLFIFVLLGALVYGIFQFVRAEKRTWEAAQTIIYIVVYPVVVYLAWLARPLPAWVVMPIVVAGLPWVVAGIHLNEIVKDPSVAKDNELVGFSYRFWIWGGAVAVVLGLIVD